MRLLQYLSRFRARDGGVPRSVLDLTAALAAGGHEVRLLTGGTELVPTEWRAGGGEGRARQPELVELAPWRWARRLGGRDGDLVDDALRWCDLAHLHVPWDPLGAQIGRRAVAAGKPYVLTAHGMLDEWTMAQRSLKKRAFLAFCGRRYLEGAASVHCTSRTEAEQSSRWCPRARMAVAPLLTDLSPFVDLPAKPVLGARAPRVLFLGRLDPIKSIDVLLAAMRRVVVAMPEATLDIAGRGDERFLRGLESMAARLAFPSPVAVRFVGEVAGETKLALLREADLLVLPSSHENWGVVLVEALASATPVVATSAVNIWREIASSGGATIVPPRDIDALADAIATCLADRAALRASGVRGREWVFRELAPERVVKQYEAMYGEAMRAVS